MRNTNILSLLFLLAGYITFDVVQIAIGGDAPAFVRDDLQMGNPGLQVSCGCHEASSCAQCGNQPYLCHGNCTWTPSSGCVLKQGLGECGGKLCFPGYYCSPPCGCIPVSHRCLPSNGTHPPGRDQDVCEESLCSSTDGCSLAKNTLLTTLPQLTNQFRISLEFQANEKPVSRANVIFFTYGGPTTVPALMFENTGQLRPMFDINDQGNYGSTTAKSYSLHQWHSVEFSQTLTDSKYMYKVVVDGEIVNGPVENKQSQIFSNIEVYASNPWVDALNGSIRNLLINTDSSGVCGECVEEYDINIKGTNVEPYGIVWHGIKSCKRWCQLEPECHFWSFRESDNACWIKKFNESTAYNALFTSGNKLCTSPAPTRNSYTKCVQEEGIKYRGSVEMGNNIGLYTIVNGIEGCAKLCRENKECQVWSINTENNRCWIKTEVIVMDKEENFVSGNWKC